MSIVCVVLKITLYHDDVSGMIPVKNGAALGRNVLCILRLCREICLPCGRVTGGVQDTLLIEQRALGRAVAGFSAEPQQIWVGRLGWALPFLTDSSAPSWTRVLAWCGHCTNPKS